MVTEPTAYILPLVQLGGGLLAVFTAWTGYRGWRLARSKALAAFWTGFACLAVAQAAASILEFATLNDPEIAVNRFDPFDVLFWTYHLFFLAGVVAVFVSFGRHPFKWSFVVAPVVLLIAGPILLFLQAIVLFFIVLHAGLNHIGRARPGSLQTAVGFFLLLFAQFLFLNDVGALFPDSEIWTAVFPPFQGGPPPPLNPRHLGGELFAFAGYLLLHFAVTRPRGSP